MKQTFVGKKRNNESVMRWLNLMQDKSPAVWPSSNEPDFTILSVTPSLVDGVVPENIVVTLNKPSRVFSARLVSSTLPLVEIKLNESYPLYSTVITFEAVTISSGIWFVVLTDLRNNLIRSPTTISAVRPLIWTSFMNSTSPGTTFTPYAQLTEAGAQLNLTAGYIFLASNPTIRYPITVTSPNPQTANITFAPVVGGLPGGIYKMSLTNSTGYSFESQSTGIVTQQTISSITPTLLSAKEANLLTIQLSSASNITSATLTDQNTSTDYPLTGDFPITSSTINLYAPASLPIGKFRVHLTDKYESDITNSTDISATVAIVGFTPSADIYIGQQISTISIYLSSSGNQLASARLVKTDNTLQLNLPIKSQAFDDNILSVGPVTINKPGIYKLEVSDSIGNIITCPQRLDALAPTITRFEIPLNTYIIRGTHVFWDMIPRRTPTRMWFVNPAATRRYVATVVAPNTTGLAFIAGIDLPGNYLLEIEDTTGEIIQSTFTRAITTFVTNYSGNDYMVGAGTYTLSPITLSNPTASAIGNITPIFRSKSNLSDALIGPSLTVTNSITSSTTINFSARTEDLDKIYKLYIRDEYSNEFPTKYELTHTQWFRFPRISILRSPLLPDYISNSVVMVQSSVSSAFTFGGGLTLDNSIVYVPKIVGISVCVSFEVLEANNTSFCLCLATQSLSPTLGGTLTVSGTFPIGLVMPDEGGIFRYNNGSGNALTAAKYTTPFTFTAGSKVTVAQLSNGSIGIGNGDSVRPLTYFTPSPPTTTPQFSYWYFAARSTNSSASKMSIRLIPTTNTNDLLDLA